MWFFEITTFGFCFVNAKFYFLSLLPSFGIAKFVLLRKCKVWQSISLFRLDIARLRNKPVHFVSLSKLLLLSKLPFVFVLILSLCFSWRCLHNRGLSCIWTCLHYRGMCCSWRFLHHKGLSFIWTCLHYRGLSCPWKCLLGPKLHLYLSTLQKPGLLLKVSSPQGPELHLDVSTLQRPVLPLDMSTCRSRSWTCLHYKGLCWI
jgi:hypothetical protein